MMPRILAFASSTRRESFNKKLVAIAAQGAREAGAEVTVIDLKDFPLPLLGHRRTGPPDPFFDQLPAALVDDPLALIPGAGQADVWIQAAAGCCYHVGRDLLQVGLRE